MSRDAWGHWRGLRVEAMYQQDTCVPLFSQPVLLRQCYFLNISSAPFPAGGPPSFTTIAPPGDEKPAGLLAPCVWLRTGGAGQPRSLPSVLVPEQFPPGHWQPVHTSLPACLLSAIPYRPESPVPQPVEFAHSPIPPTPPGAGKGH